MRNLSFRALVEERFIAQKRRNGEEVLASLGMTVARQWLGKSGTLRGCILKPEGTFRLAGHEMSHLYPTTRGHRFPFWRSAVLWLCGFSLLFALASRVPRFSGTETSWVRAAPPHITAKILAKDLYLLQAPLSGILTPPRVTLIRKLVKETQAPFAVSLDNRLYTRPPPAA